MCRSATADLRSRIYPRSAFNDAQVGYSRPAVSDLPEIGIQRCAGRLQPTCVRLSGIHSPVGLIRKCRGSGFRAPAFGRPRNDKEEIFSILLKRTRLGAVIKRRTDNALRCNAGKTA